MSNLPPHAYVLGVGPSVHVAQPEPQRPKLWYLHLTYCVLLGVVYVACIVGAAVYFIYRDTFSPPDMQAADVLQLDIYAAVIGVVSAPLAAAFLAAPFFPRKPWAWTAHLVLVCIGLTSACCLPVCIPVLIQWLKPETKAWFGRR